MISKTVGSINCGEYSTSWDSNTGSPPWPPDRYDTGGIKPKPYLVTQPYSGTTTGDTYYINRSQSLLNMIVMLTVLKGEDKTAFQKLCKDWEAGAAAQVFQTLSHMRGRVDFTEKTTVLKDILSCMKLNENHLEKMLDDIISQSL